MACCPSKMTCFLSVPFPQVGALRRNPIQTISITKTFKKWLSHLSQLPRGPGDVLCGRCYMAGDPTTYPFIHQNQQCPVREESYDRRLCFWCYKTHARPQGYQCQWSARARKARGLVFKTGCGRCGLSCPSGSCATDEFIPEVLASLQARGDWLVALARVWGIPVRQIAEGNGFYTFCFQNTKYLHAALIHLVIPQPLYQRLVV